MLGIISERIDEILSEYEANYPCVGEGRSRKVFQVSPDFVIKVPKNMAGITDNDYEARASANQIEEDFIPLAACQVLHDEIGIPLLRMEVVRIETKDLPDWADYVDCAQVGWTREGKLVAYDFGLN